MRNIKSRLLSACFQLTVLLTLQTLISIPLLAAPNASRDVHNAVDPCVGAVLLAGDTWIDDELRAGEHRLYAVDVDRAGFLNVEATHLGPNDALPNLQILNSGCRPVRDAFAFHRAHRAAVVGGDTYFLLVTNGASSPQTRYRLQAAYASVDELNATQNTTGDGAEEPMDEWEGFTGGHQLAHTTQNTTGDGAEEPMDEWEGFTGGHQLAHTTQNTTGDGAEEPMDEWEGFTGGHQLAHTTQNTTGDGAEEPMDEWEGFTGGDVALAAFADWRVAQSVDPASPSAKPWDSVLDAALCPRLAGDDHSETLGCASEMILGGRVRADLEHGQMEDRDAYTFVVQQRARVIVESTGDLDLRGVLYNAAGDRVLQDDEGAERGNFYLETILEPGRYYLRVDSLSTYPGDYALHSAIVPEHWQMASGS